MSKPMELYASTAAVLDESGRWLGLLGVRLLLAYEFWEAGLAKLQGENWFGELNGRFPFPFHAMPVEINWQLATWAELLGPIALLLGLGTRFFSLALMVLTLVAIAAVHAGHGYNVCGDGWKLPAIHLAMLWALLLSGPGRLSLDHWLKQRRQQQVRRLWS